MSRSPSHRREFEHGCEHGCEHGIHGPVDAFTAQGPVALTDPDYEDAPRAGGTTPAPRLSCECHGVGGAGRSPRKNEGLSGWENHADQTAASFRRPRRWRGRAEPEGNKRAGWE
ncbi:hypothetical protein GCM10009555_093860 [Acrocarpospora macrocephala]|uniref:Uncharacterized protein n=1 Tax=Acrocarpospora macrocephala TaxID=150177 RepID=A0A5M3X7A2_9ACTN|nr:hypothetical protein Amac_076550 [Acrocarpospora macrocephala]